MLAFFNFTNNLLCTIISCQKSCNFIIFEGRHTIKTLYQVIWIVIHILTQVTSLSLPEINTIILTVIRPPPASIQQPHSFPTPSLYFVQSQYVLQLPFSPTHDVLAPPPVIYDDEAPISFRHPICPTHSHIWHRPPPLRHPLVIVDDSIATTFKNLTSAWPCKTCTLECAI